MMILSNFRRPSTNLILCGAMLFALVALIMRASGMYVVVLGDEYTYSSLSRLLPFSSSYIPGFLYLGIYRITNMCGDGFLECARALNAVFFVMSAPFIYWTAKKVCGSKTALFISILALLSPANSYTIYFMPEPLYLLSFWVCIWYLLNQNEDSPLGNWAILGLLCGISALIKPHAMFIMPGIACYILYLHFYSFKNWIKASVLKSTTFVATVFLTKFLISYLMAGKNGLTFLGNFYNKTLEGSTSNTQRYLDILEATPKIAEGHVLALCILFGVALVAIIANITTSIRERESGSSTAKISALSGILLLNLLAVVALFSASVAGTNTVETAVRLHMRYYDFIFPLFYIVAASLLSTSKATKNTALIISTGVVTLITLYAIGTRLAPFTPYMVDSPELRGFTFNGTAFVALSGLALLSTLALFKSAKFGATLFIFAFLPASILVSTIYVNKEVSQRLVPDNYDKAGIFAKLYFSQQDLQSLMLVGDDPAGALRALFYADNSEAVRGFPIDGRPFTSADMGQKSTLLVIGNVPLDPQGLSIQRFNGFVLATKAAPPRLSFDTDSWPTVVESVTGLAKPESWGAWSVAKEVTIKFRSPLPPHFTLKVEGHAFGPNQNQPIVVSLGEPVASFSLAEKDKTVEVEIQNATDSRTIRFSIPNPTSPMSLGQSVDERDLGIALKRLEVIPQH